MRQFHQSLRQLRPEDQSSPTLWTRLAQGEIPRPWTIGIIGINGINGCGLALMARLAVELFVQWTATQ